MRRLIAILVALFPLAALPSQQLPVLVPLEKGSCGGCAVRLEYVATIGSENDREVLPESGVLLALRDGSYLARTWEAKLPLLHYDARGKYLGPVGTIGDGPGEYRWIESIALARGDSISLMGNGRLVTISVTSGKGHSEKAPRTASGFQHVVLPDGQLLVDVKEQHQRAFALLSPTGTVVKTFGDTAPQIVLPHQNGRKISDDYANMFAMALSPSRGVWAVSMRYRHRLQRVDANGALLSDIRRSPAWFAPYTYDDIDEKVYRMGPLRAPTPAVSGSVGIDAAGHLLVESLVADAHWQKDPKAPPPPKPGVEYPVEKMEPTGGMARYVDGILEIYDEKSGAFVGSWRSDMPLGNLMSNGMLYTWDASGDGVVVKVYRVKIG